MVGSHRLGKLSNVDAHHDEVLPDLPLLKVTPESFLQGPEALLPADTRHRGKEAAPGWYTTDSVCQCNLYEGSDTAVRHTALTLTSASDECGLWPGCSRPLHSERRAAEEAESVEEGYVDVHVCLSV